ncbi:hypothetical protein DL769_006058 [Monosporascus sp. CRB-8-3]|nr:hypothetical protein DL769_006058 [Monosporascus sp. CRB-8-3]
MEVISQRIRNQRQLFCATIQQAEQPRFETTTTAVTDQILTRRAPGLNTLVSHYGYPTSRTRSTGGHNWDSTYGSAPAAVMWAPLGLGPGRDIISLEDLNSAG